MFGKHVFQVVRCCLEHAASVAKIFLTSDVVVTEIKEEQPAAAGNPMDASGKHYCSVDWSCSSLYECSLLLDFPEFCSVIYA
jgi:hypothetical protein